MGRISLTPAALSPDPSSPVPCCHPHLPAMSFPHPCSLHSRTFRFRNLFLRFSAHSPYPLARATTGKVPRTHYFGNTLPISSDLLRSLPICSDLFSEQTRATPFCWPLLEVLNSLNSRPFRFRSPFLPLPAHSPHPLARTTTGRIPKCLASFAQWQSCPLNQREREPSNS